jgi:perosamine synthetase
VLLPSFHCHSVVEPALRAGIDVRFYRVDRTLRPDLDDVLAKARADVAAVLFINYFGFPAAFEPVAADLRARDVLLVEDCSHSFLQVAPLALSGGCGDVSVYSFWKLVPSGVGGAMRGTVPGPRPRLRRSSLRQSVVRSARMIEQAALAAPTSLLARAWQRADEIRKRARSVRSATLSPTAASGPAEHFSETEARTRMPWLARHVLRCADLAAVATARRANFVTYAAALDPSAVVPLISALPERVCPWAYPVLVPDRSRHDRKLRELGVPVWTFGDVLHPALDAQPASAASADARFLAERLLCLPIHQGIEPADIQAWCSVVNSYQSARIRDAVPLVP